MLATSERLWIYKATVNVNIWPAFGCSCAKARYTRLLFGFRDAAAARGAGAGLLERVAAVTGCGSAPACRLKPVAAERRLSCCSALLPSRPPQLALAGLCAAVLHPYAGL